MADFTLKQGDTRPVLDATLLDNAVAINLTTATAVKFIMRQVGNVGSPKVNAACTIVSAVAGTVRYTWIPADTDTNGSFDAEFEITWNDGGKTSVPNAIPTGATRAYYEIEILDDLG